MLSGIKHVGCKRLEFTLDKALFDLENSIVGGVGIFAVGQICFETYRVSMRNLREPHRCRHARFRLPYRL